MVLGQGRFMIVVKSTRVTTFVNGAHPAAVVLVQLVTCKPLHALHVESLCGLWHMHTMPHNCHAVMLRVEHFFMCLSFAMCCWSWALRFTCQPACTLYLWPCSRVQ